jgi:ABC-type transport system involved in cytochrome c biogenesis permease subunit
MKRLYLFYRSLKLALLAVASSPLAHAHLFSHAEEKKKRLDRLTYLSIGIGYPVFTAGALIFGAIWARTAWGTYWSWDPKETWALVTRIVYTLYLHSYG